MRRRHRIWGSSTKLPWPRKAKRPVPQSHCLPKTPAVQRSCKRALQTMHGTHRGQQSFIFVVDSEASWSHSRALRILSQTQAATGNRAWKITGPSLHRAASAPGPWQSSGPA